MGRGRLVGDLFLVKARGEVNTFAWRLGCTWDRDFNGGYLALPREQTL